jgi:hypothetical protein
MINKLKIYFSIILIFTLTSCYPNWYKPMGHLFRQMPKGGTPGFELGWIHGCESGLGSQFGGAIYMNFYSWKRDPDLIVSNPDYQKIRKKYRKELRKVNWNNTQEVKRNLSDYTSIFWGAHTFCHHAVLGILQSADMTPTLPGEERYNPGAHSIGNIWKMTGKGDTRIGTGFW